MYVHLKGPCSLNRKKPVSGCLSQSMRLIHFIVMGRPLWIIDSTKPQSADSGNRFAAFLLIARTRFPLHLLHSAFCKQGSFHFIYLTESSGDNILQLKGTVPRVFLPLGFFVKLFLLGPVDKPRNDFDFFRLFAEIFDYFSASPVSTTPAKHALPVSLTPVSNIIKSLASPVSMTPAKHRKSRISPRIFEKNRNCY